MNPEPGVRRYGRLLPPAGGCDRALAPRSTAASRGRLTSSVPWVADGCPDARPRPTDRLEPSSGSSASRYHPRSPPRRSDMGAARLIRIVDRDRQLEQWHEPWRTKTFFSLRLTKTATWPVRLTGWSVAL